MRRVIIASVALSIGLVSTTADAAVISYGHQYLRDVAPVNGAMSRFVVASRHWTNRTTDAQAERDATPFINALRSLQTSLANQHWPLKARRDVRSLYFDISSVEADLLSLGGLSMFNSSQWLSTFASDVTKMGSDATLVRHDLGLHPAS